MSNSISSQTQQQKDRVLPDSSILSKIADIPSEATKFLSEPKEYAKKHDLQLSDQALKEIDLIAYYDIPDECIVLQSRNPFLKMPVFVCKSVIRDKYQPDICPVITMSAAAAAAVGAGTAALAAGAAAAAASKS